MEKSQKFHSRNVLSISFAHFIHDVYSFFLSPILPLLIEKFSISYFSASLLDFSRRFPSILNPFIGMYIGRFRIKYFVIFAPAITCTSMSLIGVAPHYTLLVGLLLVMGISNAFFHVPAPVMIKSFSGPRTGKGMSFYMVGGEVARTLGPVIIVGAVSLWGLEGTYRLIPFGLAASLWLWYRFKDITIQKETSRESRTGFKTTLKKHMWLFILLGGIIFFRAIMKMAIINFLPTYLKETGKSLWFGGISLSVFQIAGAVGTYFAGSLSDKLGRMKTLLIITVVTPLTVLLFVYVQGIWVFPVLVLMGFFMLASGPVLLALVMDKATRHQSFMNGIYMTLTFVSASISSLLTGLMGDWVGLVSTYKISAFLAFLAIPFVIFLSGRERKKLL
jgi:FSR family fosmidomycin resistance protein-like MFS transporter